MGFLSTSKKLLVVAYHDWKLGEQASRIFRKSFARYKKRGQATMLSKLNEEYSRLMINHEQYSLQKQTMNEHFIRSAENILGNEDLSEIFNHFSNTHASPDVKTKKLSINQSNIFEAFLRELEGLNGFLVTPAMLIGLFDGSYVLPIRFFKEDNENAAIYLKFAKKFLIQHDLKKAKSFLYMCLDYENPEEALELLGNVFLEQKEYEYAEQAYSRALHSNNPSSWLKKNFEQCLHHSWHAKKEEHEKTLSLKNDNNQLIEDFSLLTQTYYKHFYTLFNGGELKPVETRLNSKKVLIIGDHHITQCVRYRILQKVEQLESAGYDVKVLDWTKLNHSRNIIELFDIVIFYRTPAVFEVIKAIAYVNALGKISIFEVDDLIFDPTYPAPIASYGGSVTLETYNSLKISMALSRAAAELCTYGLASTQPLQKKLAEVVKSRICLLHRNGLDKFSLIETIDQNKPYIDLFYGSGTLAHNSDFIEVALPALESILDEFPATRLIIVGHLILPTFFVKKFGQRIKTIPKLEDVSAYWNYLKFADINLAVLHTDEINDCKSELKWFEAACFQIPSVVSSTKNYQDVINNGEDGFVVSNHEEWYSALKKLIENKELRQHVGQKALSRIQNEYSVEALGQSLSNHLQNLLLIENKKVGRRKKIALVNVYFPPQAIGGATRVLADNFEELKEKYSDDYEVVVFTSEAECVKPYYELKAYSYKSSRVYKANIFWRENMDWHAQDLKMYALFKEFLELEQPDIVHFHSVQRLSASIVEATKDLAIPYVVTAHDAWWISDHQFLVDKNGKVYPDGHLDAFEERILPNNVTLEESIKRSNYLKGQLNSAAKVLTVSEAFAKIYLKNGIHNIEVNRNGLSRLDWQVKDTSYTNKVVCALIGGLSAHKGYEILKQAISQLQPKNIELLLVDHSKEPWFEENTLWGKVKVRTIGKVQQKNVISLYKKIDVLLAPSIWPESYGLVTREATACGCWVIASNLGGIGEDVTEDVNGFTITPDAKNLMRSLTKVDKMPERFKKACMQTNHRTVDKQVEELVVIYNELSQNTLTS